MLGKVGRACFLFALSMSVSIAVAREGKAPQAAFSIADTRTELEGRWQGRLEYLDYQANQWFGIPVTVEVELIGDGATMIRKAAFDDGSSGTVYITLVSMLAPDGQTEFVGSFRADRPAELGSFVVRLVESEEDVPLDATHWTMVAESRGEDDNRPARIRETTTRNGAELLTLKEIDFTDDDKEEWLQRNRTILRKVLADR